MAVVATTITNMAKMAAVAVDIITTNMVKKVAVVADIIITNMVKKVALAADTSIKRFLQTGKSLPCSILRDSCE